jgi:hypothetical protein
MQAQQEGQAKLAMMAQQNADQNHIAAAKAQLESQLALRQQNLDAWLQAHEMALKAHQDAQDQKRADNESQAKVKILRKGGALNK